MSMVFRFRMLSDENDNFVRDYEVLYDTTLLEFHDFILRSLEYEECMVCTVVSQRASVLGMVAR